jgi:5-methylcytosine-specific restriction enzyme subunit McrC
MSEPIVVKEYSKNIKIKDCDLNKLHHYLECQQLDSALKVTPSGIETTSWVGVIKYKNTNFQILPKLIYTKKYKEDYDDKIKEETKSNILKNLIFMLSYTKKLDIKTSNDAKLLTSKNPFIEILIREYAKSLFECLKRFTPKKYVREENNLNYLKGKIKFTENIRYNSSNLAKFYCEYDEFSENNILNQLFLFVSTCLYNISNDSYNKKTLKFIINYYSDIKLVRFNRFTAEKINLSRNQKLFKKPFNLAKMFIEKTSVDLSKNKFENITLIWDMNKLFEEFVFEIMKKHEAEIGCKLTAQRGKKLLVGDTSKKRNTFVDILIEKNDGEKIILDTKYKKFASSDDFSDADVFQVSTYCLLHKAKHAILLYPKWDTSAPEKDFHLNIDNPGESDIYQIDFKTINLQYDYIGKKENLESIKEDIKRILNVA